MQKKRNYNIDFLRGVATLWIIVIHTAFWSGQSYLPPKFYNLTLIIDVPIFMYISGISYSYVNSISKNIKGLINQWKKWCYFLLFYTILIVIICRGQIDYSEILHWIFYTFPSVTKLTVVQGSIWFIIMYIKVTLLCSVILFFINNYIKDEKDKEKTIVNVIFLLIIMFGYTSYSGNVLCLTTYTSFYSIVYLVGYLTSRYKINLKQMFIYLFMNFIIIFIIFKLEKIGIENFQDIKFPPSIPYMFLSAISIIIAWYIKDHIKIKEKNPVNYIGKNAIFFYFVQGISSSLISYIIPYMPHMNKYLLFACMLFINIMLTTIISILLEKLNVYIGKKDILKLIKNHIIPLQKKKNEL